METNLQRPQSLFLQQVRYEIPAFQRPYVWKQGDQWEPLWDDVEQLAQSILEDGETKPHFMGAVVLQQIPHPSGTIERRIVVDGQQRITTLQLLMDAIQEVLENREHSHPAKRLADLVENREEYRDGNPDNAFKVWPTVFDRVAFRHAMSNDMSATDYSASRIVQAHDYFRGQAERWLDKVSDENGTSDGAASALEKAVREKLELVVIDLGNTDDPHVIFETLNARGTPLLQSDMIKNKILRDAGVGVDYEDKASLEQHQLWPFSEDRWWTREIGRGFQRRPRIDAYLNHWLTLRNKREMKAYDEFRAFQGYAGSWQGTEQTIHDIAKDIADVGEIYRDIEDERRADIAAFLRRRNVMNVGAITPLLLWLLSVDVPQTTLTKCLNALESFLVRRVVCGYSARSYGSLFVELLARLADTSADEADKILLSFLAEQESQAGVWPRDSELRDRFVTAPLYQWLTRGRLGMLLMGIEEKLRTEKAETQEVPHNLQIEHIMPQAWRANWALPEDDNREAALERDRVIHTIGNLTLVNGRLNTALSNGPWDCKRKALDDHSVLFLNRRLVKKAPQIWDEAAIEKRAKWLFKRAVEIWPHPDTVG